MRNLLMTAVASMAILASGSAIGLPVIINFDDVVGSNQDITNRYAAQGVTLGTIENPLPLEGEGGIFPAPLTLPAVRAGVQTWIQGYGSATSAPQVAVAMPFPGAEFPTGGILISFDFDVNFVSMVGNDLACIPSDCESVTLSAYNAGGNRIGQTFTSDKLPGNNDQAFASIAMPGMRHVAFNYAGTQFGFYAIDDLTFDVSPVPEPQTWALMAAGLVAVRVMTKARKAK